MLHVAEQTGLAVSIRGRCSDVCSAARSRPESWVECSCLPACLPAVPVLYFHGRWQVAIHVAGRGAADMTVLQNHIHMSKSGQKGVANAMPGPGSENAIIGRRQIVQIHRQTSRLQGDALCSFCFGGEEIRMGMSLRTLEVSGQRNLLS